MKNIAGNSKLINVKIIKIDVKMVNVYHIFFFQDLNSFECFDVSDEFSGRIKENNARQYFQRKMLYVYGNFIHYNWLLQVHVYINVTF